MTKEQMIAKVEVAHKIYEELKVYPVVERDQVMSMVHQFSQKDWNEYHEKQKPCCIGANTPVATSN